MEEVEYLGERIYRWQVGASTYLAWPERGARLMNWNLSYPDGTFRDIVRWPSLDSPDQVVKARGGNPILFPFSARTFHQGEIHQWQDPDGQVRPMPMHGLARQGQFSLSRIDARGFSARFLPTKEDSEAYPYDYDFEVVYRFDEKEFIVELRLANHGNKVIPWSAGHHFYFTLPWADQTTREDYVLRIPAKKAARHAANGSLTPLPVPDETLPLSNQGLVDRIHYQLTDSVIECQCQKDDSKLEIEIGTNSRPNPGFAIVTWTESNDAPFYCIEPWMGPPNAPEHRIGLHEVPPGETGRFSVTVRV